MNRDLFANTMNLVTAPLKQVKEITDTINSTISTSAERTWNMMAGAVGGGKGDTANATTTSTSTSAPNDTAATGSTAAATAAEGNEAATAGETPGPPSSTSDDNEQTPTKLTLQTQAPQSDDAKRKDDEGPEVVASAKKPDDGEDDNDAEGEYNEDDLVTPRPGTWRPKPVDGSPDEETLDLTESSHLNEDYFTSNQKRFGGKSTLSPAQQTAVSPSASGGGSTPGVATPTFERLQGKPTTALSLSDAHANDGSLGGGSSAGSVNVAPSETTSIQSLVPGNQGGDDVEGMLGSILHEGGERLPTGEGQEWGLPRGAEGDDYWASDEDLNELDDDDESLSEDERISRWRARRKHFFILSAAGKPVYSRYGEQGVVSQFMGVIQTIISFFQDGEDPVRSFTAGRHKFSILQEGHLYLVAISSTGESDAQLRAQLDALYMQVLSTLTLTTVTKVFSQKENFDLRRLLGGTEVFLDALSDAMTYGDPNTLLGAVECVKMRKSEREKINSILLKCRSPSLLYGLMIADGRLVSVIRPKRHSLHPPDLQLLFSMLFNASTFRDGGEHWTPICLPKFNSKGFLYAYICFFRKDVAIVLISAGKDNFFEMKDMREKVEEQLEKSSVTSTIEAAVKRGRYLISDAVPGTIIKHFLYKSKQNVQFTMPTLELSYSQPLARRRLMTLYGRLHAAVHAKNAHLKVHHSIRSSSVSLAWCTPTFELYCVAGREVARNELASGANAVVKWVKREEERLFIVGGATF